MEIGGGGLKGEMGGGGGLADCIAKLSVVLYYSIRMLF